MSRNLPERVISVGLRRHISAHDVGAHALASAYRLSWLSPAYDVVGANAMAEWIHTVTGLVRRDRYLECSRSLRSLVPDASRRDAQARASKFGSDDGRHVCSDGR